jgi:aminoglycoside phosphotransferase (APT) family kinase protein
VIHTPETRAERATPSNAYDDRLTERTLIAYLDEKGLIRPQAIVDGWVRVEQISRRNLSFRVTTALGPHYFIKQGLGVERATTVAREAAFLHAIDAAPDAKRLRRMLPRVRDLDEERHILIFDLVPGARSLDEHHHRTGRWSSALAHHAALALRRLHRWQPASTGSGIEAESRPPWVLSIHRPERAFLNRMSGGSLDVIKIAQAARPLVAELDALRIGWQPESIIHGDAKWDNFVVHPIGKAHAPRLTLADWEMVQLGDPLWDVGAYLSQYLDTWIASIPASENSPLSQARAASVPLQRLQPAIQQFWKSYAGGNGSESADGGAALRLMVRYAAARLVQTAIEAESLRPVASNTSVLRLQVAENMLQRPGEAASSLFGLTQ